MAKPEGEPLTDSVLVRRVRHKNRPVFCGERLQVQVGTLKTHQSGCPRTVQVKTHVVAFREQVSLEEIDIGLLESSGEHDNVGLKLWKA